MTVQIGGRRDHGFDEPLALMSDCHRRVEHFLDVLLRVVDISREGSLPPQGRSSLEGSLRYFREAAPRHTADEEESLFPRIRAARGDLAPQATAAIDRLEAQHTEAESLHDEVHRLGAAWLASGRLTKQELARLRGSLSRLHAIYEEHIAVEDHCIFPLAARLLDAQTLAKVGHEMAARRGIRLIPERAHDAAP